MEYSPTHWKWWKTKNKIVLKVFTKKILSFKYIPIPQTFLVVLHFRTTQQDTSPVWYSKEDNPVIKNQLPRELCLWLLAIKFLEASLEGDDWGGGNSWTTWQIAKSSISVSLPWHFNGPADLHFNESSWEWRNKAETLNAYNRVNQNMICNNSGKNDILSRFAKGKSITVKVVAIQTGTVPTSVKPNVGTNFKNET